MCHARSCVGVHASPTHAIICKVPYLTLPYPTLSYPTLPYPTLPYPTLSYLTLSYPSCRTPVPSNLINFSLFHPCIYFSLSLSLPSSRLLCRAQNISCFISGIAMERTYMAEIVNFPGTYACRYPVQYTHEIR